MTATVLSIIGVAIAIIGAYFAARSNARDQSRMRQAAVEKSVEEARQPLLLTIADQQQRLIRYEQRIQELEDRLYGGHPK